MSKSIVHPFQLIVKSKHDDFALSDLICSHFNKLCVTYGVSAKEMVIGHMLLMGFKNSTIARMTCRSIKTISAQKNSLFKKMHVKSEVSLITLVFYHFLLDGENGLIHNKVTNSVPSEVLDETTRCTASGGLKK